MKAYVDKETCVGCGLCPAVCPEVFKMEDDGKAIAFVDTVPDGIEDSAKDAESQCPVDAISVE